MSFDCISVEETKRLLENDDVTVIDIRDINKYFQNYWDFGVLGAAYDSAITWIIDSADVDNGTFQNPDTRSIELGII
jgi:hypothetical protein